MYLVNSLCDDFVRYTDLYKYDAKICLIKLLLSKIIFVTH